MTGTVTAVSTGRWWLAGDRDGERGADLAHSSISEASDSVAEYVDRHTFHRIEVHRRAARDRIRLRIQHDLARQPTDRCGAWPDERPPQSGYRGVTRKNDDGSSTNVGKFTPPCLTPLGKCAHEVPVTRRQDARSPHSSTSWSGCSS